MATSLRQSRRTYGYMVGPWGARTYEETSQKTSQECEVEARIISPTASWISSGRFFCVGPAGRAWSVKHAPRPWGCDVACSVSFFGRHGHVSHGEGVYSFGTCPTTNIRKGSFVMAIPKSSIKKAARFSISGFPKTACAHASVSTPLRLKWRKRGNDGSILPVHAAREMCFQPRRLWQTLYPLTRTYGAPLSICSRVRLAGHPKPFSSRYGRRISASRSWRGIVRLSESLSSKPSWLVRVMSL